MLPTSNPKQSLDASLKISRQCQIGVGTGKKPSPRETQEGSRIRSPKEEILNIKSSNFDARRLRTELVTVMMNARPQMIQCWTKMGMKSTRTYCLVIPSLARNRTESRRTEHNSPMEEGYSAGGAVKGTKG
ncbi:unnamed protein product [Thlaspi arvense]|uniref:Uncharacterized protein n=1 Tax=Thlaspi arvense TaxID=13288 RepID=A0AAU9SCV2_THLAR|nr:unnamed protein product [Thlaspi arvense]